MKRSILVIFMLTAAYPALARVPVTGRTQHMLFPRAPVQAAAARAYKKTLARLRARHELDTNRKTLVTVRRLSGRLIAQAIELKPVAANWPWEIHITSDPQVAAYARAGGKLLISTAFIHQYHLSDNEVAVVLAHEIGHVIAEHVREEISTAATLDPPPPHYHRTVADVIDNMQVDFSVYLRLQPLSRLQELEADDIGVVLAARAGFPPSAVVSFYTKLARAGDHYTLLDDHGPSRQREAFALSMAEYAKPVYEASLHEHLPRYVFR